MAGINHFKMFVTCPECGAPVRPVNIGDPADRGTTINAVVRCTRDRCRREFAIHVRLMSMGVFNDEGETHGNSTAYARHKRRGEQPCEECRESHNRDWSDKKSTRRSVLT